MFQLRDGLHGVTLVMHPCRQTQELINNEEYIDNLSMNDAGAFT